MSTIDLARAANESATTWTVGKVARLAGISVRTLHHYDEIGLLSPSRRTAAGHRHYLAQDLDRLRAVLTWRELDFALDDIADLVDAQVDTRSALLDQRDHLATRIDRLHRIVAAIDRELEATTMDITLTPEEKLEVFGDFLPEDYEEEARHRWGETDAWQQSQQRVSTYDKDDWIAIRDEAEGIEADFAALLADGSDPSDEVAMQVAERHRRHIGTWFYDCSPEMHENLGQMYVADPRFTAHYDERRDGLAQFVSDAITANALRHLD